VCSCIIASFLYFPRSYRSPHNGAYIWCYKIDELNERLMYELHLSNQLFNALKSKQINKQFSSYIFQHSRGAITREFWCH
jgi:hypothetical protein